MPYIIKAECPKCGKTANGYTAIELKFGWRITKDKLPQSYCISCRKSRKTIKRS